VYACVVVVGGGGFLHNFCEVQSTFTLAKAVTKSKQQLFFANVERILKKVFLQKFQ
jgi:hypothetical protein